MTHKNGSIHVGQTIPANMKSTPMRSLALWVAWGRLATTKSPHAGYTPKLPKNTQIGHFTGLKDNSHQRSFCPVMSLPL